MASAPSLAGSYHASCASNEEESSFLKRIRLLHWVRLGLSFLALGISISIIACEAVPYRHYRHTSSFESVGLYLWPLNFDLRPTIAILACGCVTAFLSLVFIVVALLPSVRLCLFVYVLNITNLTTAAAFPHQTRQSRCSNNICSRLHHLPRRPRICHIPPRLLIPGRLRRRRDPPLLDL